MAAPKSNLLKTKVKIPLEFRDAFVDWQTKLHKEIVSFPGFISLEILSPVDPGFEWTIVQRFFTFEQVRTWRSSVGYKELLNELVQLLGDKATNAIQEDEELGNGQEGITEVFVTQVEPEKRKAYQEWIAKIHQAEVKFPGFRGVYVQSPQTNEGKNWITFLQFDTPENLDRWLTSPERQKVLKESKDFISSLDSHRVVSSYSGWFASIAKDGKLPSAWKQTMIVLLVLFPVVMLELKYLSPLTAHLNSSVANFIGNAISVTLLAWPLVPIAIRLLKWWLVPKEHAVLKTFFGTILVIMLYLIEISLFWDLLK